MRSTDHHATRRLPHVARPVPGESFASWLYRTADELEVPVGLVAERLQLPGRRAIRGGLQVRAFGVALSERQLGGVTAATGLAARDVNAMHLTHFAGTCLPEAVAVEAPPTRDVTPRGWQWLQGSRFCPLCLAEKPASWDLRWRLSVVASCVVHATLLLDACPVCRARVGTDGHGGPAVLSKQHRVVPNTCTARTTGAMCRASLGDAEAVPAPPDLVQLQRRMRTIRLDGGGLLGGQTMTASDAFALVYALAAVVRFARKPDLLPASSPPALLQAFTAHLSVSAPRGGGQSSYRDGPATATAAAAVLTVLAPALLATAPGAAERALAPLADAARARRTLIGRDPLHRLALPDVLKEALTPPMPHARVVREARRTTARVDPHNIPPVLPGRLYDQCLVSLLPHTYPWTGRRFCSLAVARASGAPSWSVAARWTGCRPEQARSVADSITRRIEDPRAFWAAIDRLGHVLEREDVHYPTRQAQVRELHVAADTVREELATSALWTRERAAHAQTYVWSEWAGGDWRESPHQVSGPSRLSSRRDGYRVWLQWAQPGLKRALLDHADQRFARE